MQRVRRLEKEGVPSKQAEAITSTITEVLNESLESVAQSFVFKPEMQRVWRLEKEGVPSKQAEAITSTITEVLNESLESVAQSFVSKPEMQRSEMIQDSNIWKFKLEMKGSQDHHYALLQRETEKLRVDIEKMRSELRYEIDKVTVGQRLDLNLERECICDELRDELAKQSAETTELITKLDREILALRAQLDAAKHDAIKLCIGILVSMSFKAAAFLRRFL
ncbi:unnamed protein product [Musa hybrid cultivar]